MIIVKKLNFVLLVIGGVALVAMTAQIGFAAISRSLFGKPISGTIEISTYYYMVAVSLMPLGAVQLGKEHVIVEVFTQFLKRSVRNRIDLFAIVVTSIYVGILTWCCLGSAIQATEHGEFLKLHAFDFQIWPGRWLLVFGALGLLVTVISQIITKRYASNDE